ncbi:MAG TPA: glycosyltransferase family 39 protein [Bryobacteraceae bacterium]|nr:glycosyltransferase family 39 protein [Bryobacteraceae bacterium]
MTLSKLSVYLLAILAATRIPLAPAYLYHFDSVNFALSLHNFNPALHQPQPPGYPLFVGLLRVLHLFIPKPEHVLLAGGIVVAAAAGVFLWRLAQQMFDDEAAVFALAIFLFTPPCWFGGITNQVRLCLAMYSTGLALLAWRALHRPVSASSLYLAFAALGLGAGFRPALGVQLAPLLLWVWWLTGHSALRLVIGVAMAAVASVPWIAAAALSVGGLTEWLQLMWTYSRDQFGGSSAAFGAPTASAWKMAARALMWNGLPAVAWIWAVPAVWKRATAAPDQKRAIFLLVWITPILFFSALIHIGDPDQALGSIPAICLIGGAVLAAFLRNIGWRRVVLAAVAVAAVNAALFFVPPGRAARASSYHTVAIADANVQAVFRSIDSAKRGAQAPVAILEFNAAPSWRHLMYYYPNDYVVFLNPDPNGTSWTVQRREALNHMRPADRLPPGARVVVLVAPSESPVALRESGWRQEDRVFYRDLETGSQVRVGPYTFSRP